MIVKANASGETNDDCKLNLRVNSSSYHKVKTEKTIFGGRYILTVVSLIAPIVILVIVFVVGLAFNFAPVKQRSYKQIPLIVFAGAVGVAGLIVTLFLTYIITDYLFNFDFMGNFALIFQDVEVDLIKYNSQIAATLVPLGMLEVGLGLGFSTAYGVTTIQLKRKPLKSKTADSDAKITIYKAMQTTKFSKKTIVRNHQSPKMTTIYEETSAV